MGEVTLKKQSIVSLVAVSDSQAVLHNCIRILWVHYKKRSICYKLCIALCFVFIADD